MLVVVKCVVVFIVVVIFDVEVMSNNVIPSFNYFQDMHTEYKNRKIKKKWHIPGKESGQY